MVSSRGPPEDGAPELVLADLDEVAVPLRAAEAAGAQEVGLRPHVGRGQRVVPRQVQLEGGGRVHDPRVAQLGVVVVGVEHAARRRPGHRVGVEVGVAARGEAGRVEEAEVDARRVRPRRGVEDGRGLRVVVAPVGAQHGGPVPDVEGVGGADAGPELLPVAGRALGRRADRDVGLHARVHALALDRRPRRGVGGAVVAQAVGQGEVPRHLPLVLGVEAVARLVGAVRARARRPGRAMPLKPKPWMNANGCLASKSSRVANW